MQWRSYTRVLTRLKPLRLASRPAFASTLNSPFPPHRRPFTLVDGKAIIPGTPLDPQPQPDWNEEVENVMAQQELVQLQQSLGLVAPKNGKPVKDVVFVCIDIEAFESDQSKITEIGESNRILRFGDQN